MPLSQLLVASFSQLPSKLSAFLDLGLYNSISTSLFTWPSFCVSVSSLFIKTPVTGLRASPTIYDDLILRFLSISAKAFSFFQIRSHSQILGLGLGHIIFLFFSAEGGHILTHCINLVCIYLLVNFQSSPIRMSSQ